MGQQIIIPGRGEITQQDILPSDLIAYYKFEETEDLKVAIDWAMNFNGKTPEKQSILKPAGDIGEEKEWSSRQPGFLGNGLVCDKTASENFSINMLLDEIPSSLEISVQFYLKFLEEIEKGEHGTYTLFSKQWATGMRWYCYLISRLESVQLHNVLSYVVADPECSSVQVSGASWGDILANGLYYKRSNILYSHSIYNDWRIYFNGTNWLIRKLTGEGEEAEWVSHFKSSGEDIEGSYSVESIGQGDVSVLGVNEVSDTIQINNIVIMTDKWYKIDLLLKLREDLPSSFGVYFGDDYSATALTSEVIDIPINTEISPQLIGGDLSDVRFCENDNTIPYIVDGFPFPSSYRYGISGIIDEVRVYRALQREVPVIRPFVLNVDIAGYGSVVKDPNKTGYNWGEEVELTASPDPGNSFLKWAGDIDTEDNPTTIIMTKDTNITAIFTGKVATPIFSPAGGLYYEEQVVSISCLTEGATIRYTTDGSTPDETSPIYTEPLNITETKTLKAKAFLDGEDPSDVATATYTLKVKTPVFNPLPGSYSGYIDVSITCQTTGATIRYTLDGTDPTETSTEYTTTIHITENKTLKARAWKTNWTTSDCRTGTYIIGVNWVRKADFGGVARHFAVGFSIGNKGYIGTGYGSGYHYYKDFWEYNPATNIFTQKADFGGSARFAAVGFSIGTKGYIGTGRGSSSSFLKDFWEYNPATNIWTQKADFGGVARHFAVGFSIGDKGYIGTGYDGSFLKDFWEYNPATNIFTQKADFGGSARYVAVGFSIGNKGYIGTGHNGSSFLKDFWEYNQSTNTFTQKANFSGRARCVAVGFSIGTKGYIGTGYDGSNYKKDFWEYNPSTNTWTQKADFGGGVRSGAVGFSIEDKGYVGTGWNGSSYKKDFWEYIP